MTRLLLLAGFLSSTTATAGPAVPMVNLEPDLDATAIVESTKPLPFGSFRYHRNTHTLKCMGAGEAFRCEVSHSNGQRVGSASPVWLDDGAVSLQLKGRGNCPKEVRFKASEAFLELVQLDRLPAKI